MSHNIAIDGRSIDTDDPGAVADALYALADAFNERAGREAAETGNSGESEPETPKSEFECRVCGATWPSKQALAGHMGGHTQSERDGETAENGSDRPSVHQIPAAADRAKAQADTLAEASEAMREALRTHKFGREGWAKAFGDCTAEGCDYAAYGFELDTCREHRSVGAKEAESANELLVA